MPIYEESVVSNLYFQQSCQIYSQSISPIYGTLQGAENYFKSKLTHQILDWLEASNEDKTAALRQATGIIESLNFSGTPYNLDQLLFFPTDELGVPADIMKACYEIALKLIQGVDPDTEVTNLAATSQGYAGGRSSFDRNFVQEHIRAGVPSAFAWSILRPYLCDPNGLRLSRGT